MIVCGMIRKKESLRMRRLLKTIGISKCNRGMTCAVTVCESVEELCLQKNVKTNDISNVAIRKSSISREDSRKICYILNNPHLFVEQ